MSMFLAGKPRNSKQPKGMCALKISPHSFIAVTLAHWELQLKYALKNSKLKGIYSSGPNCHVHMPIYFP